MIPMFTKKILILIPARDGLCQNQQLGYASLWKHNSSVFLVRYLSHRFVRVVPIFATPMFRNDFSSTGTHLIYQECQFTS